MSFNTFTLTKSVNTSGEYILPKGAFNNCKQLVAKLNVTAAAGGTTPTLDVSLQQSLDNGVTWETATADLPVKFTQKTTSTGTEVKYVKEGDNGFSGDLKIVWLIAGGGTHGTLTTDPTGANNKQTWTGKQTLPVDDNKTSLTVVEGAPGASIGVVTTGSDIVVTLAKAVAVQGSLTTALTGSNNDLIYKARTPGVAGNSITVAYLNDVAYAATVASVADSAISVALRSAITDASLTTALTGTNNDLVYSAKAHGAAGNAVHIVYAVSGNNTALSVGVVGSVITVTVATNGGGSATSTAAQVKAAVDAFPAAAALVTVANAAANDGTGVVTALTDTALSGGNDKSIVATAQEVMNAVSFNATANGLVATDLAGGNDGTGVVTALAATNLTSGADAAITSTAGNVATAIAANAGANALVGVANFAGNDGSGLMTALAKAYLDNAVGTYGFGVSGFGK